MRKRGGSVLAYGVAIAVSAAFLFPYLWMLSSAFRSTEAILTAPLRLWPESFDLKAFRDLREIGGVPIARFIVNSVVITVAATIVAVITAALGAYALVRKPGLPGFRWVRLGFLVTIMYPYMLLMIPVYIVMHQLGLLGTTAGIILFLSVGPIQFLLFEQFFRSVPKELIEAAQLDGCSELGIVWRVIVPVAKPVVATVSLITFLLTWSQWFPVLVISQTPDTYTLPVALLMLNSELGTNFQGVMALSTLTVLPVVILFLLTQRRVMDGIAAGAVKG
jgi:multiple sugar transport system permease protein